MTGAVNADSIQVHLWGGILDRLSCSKPRALSTAFVLIPYTPGNYLILLLPVYFSDEARKYFPVFLIVVFLKNECTDILVLYVLREEEFSFIIMTSDAIS